MKGQQSVSILCVVIREISPNHSVEHIATPVRAGLSRPAVYRILLVSAVVGLAVIAGCSLLLWQQRYSELTQKLDAFRSEAIMVSDATAESIKPPVSVSSQPFDWSAAQQMLERLTFPKQIDARIFDSNGDLIQVRGIGWTPQIRVEKLEPPRNFLSFRGIGNFLNTLIASSIDGKSVSYVAGGATVQSLNDMVARTLQGNVTTTIFKNADGRLLLVSCMPLQPYKKVVGAILLQVGLEI